MKKTLISILLATAGVLAAIPAAQAAGEVILATSVNDKMQAVVAEINKTQRSLVLQFADDTKLDIYNVATGITRFDTLNVGDKVNVKLTEGMALLLQKGTAGVRGVFEGEGYQESADGGGRVLTTRIRSDIVKVDAAKQLITVKNPENRLVSYKVADAELLSSAAAGDQVDLILRRTVTIVAE
ncbi:hypothetical protein [Chitinilyticum piscinae]|uniref:Uncharacterized protein n=1 Tax=Chitinilyticum piscinae TaxID=2866724 RepID=A0A8J7K1Y9_9NEIS|nr:hypothetical protein [Chitinilyticum piscinae]MBE9609307.1 hypothetical protein [Chitinilyticum piscinae]